ncbi:MAG TPA: TetR/AcrR family transcriptional regulator [Acidimicrobiales bacterium]
MPPEGLSRAAYFDAAFKLLAEHGPDDMTIAALCRELGVTKGSFYHHFRDISEFVDALLAHWASEHATKLIALSESVDDIEERFELLQGIAIGLPHGAEAAIRAWSWSNPRVAAVQREVDAARLRHLTEASIATGLDPGRSALMAKISVSVLIGIQQLVRPAQPDAIREVFEELRSWVLMPDPTASPEGLAGALS